MKKLNQIFVMAGVIAALGFGTATVFAQADAAPKPDSGGGRPSRGSWDPEQMRQRMTDRIREQMDVKGDAEWKLISERINKVMDARRDTMGSMGMGFRGGSSRSGGTTDSSSDRSSRFSSFMPQPSPEEEALKKAIDDKASADDIKAKLKKVREVRKEKEAKLEKAQEDLKKVLSVKQEAVAVMSGLLK